MTVRTRGTARPFARGCCRAAILVLLLMLLPRERAANAYELSSSQGASEDKRTRGTWAALLAGYLAVGALTTGTAYVFRQNFVGRGVAGAAASWGGSGLGAGAGYGAMSLSGCPSADCSAEEGVATAVGALLGGALASVAAFYLTREPGLSRPYLTAAGMAPFLVFLTVGTIADW